VGELKNRTRINTSIPNPMFEKLKSLSQKSQIPMSRLIEEAINDMFVKYNKRKWFD
jgi:metal-responsive CopG/Arc/MetJ family transcriptional regulator